MCIRDSNVPNWKENDVSLLLLLIAGAERKILPADWLMVKLSLTVSKDMVSSFESVIAMSPNPWDIVVSPSLSEQEKIDAKITRIKKLVFIHFIDN